MKKLMKSVLALAVAVSTVFGTQAFAADAATTAQQTGGQGKIMSYLGGWLDWTADDIQGDKLTHLYVAFARIGNDFKISDEEKRLTVEGHAELPFPDLLSANLISDEKWAEIEKVQAKYPDLKVIIAVGGWAADGFSDMAATKATREVFVDSVVKYVEEHNLDGVDIDWEYPVNGAWGVIKSREADKENFTALLQLMREKMPDKELSFCASVSGWFLDAVDIPAVSKLVDSVNLMAYDMQGTWNEYTDHHSNLYPNPANPLVSWGLSASEAVDRLIGAGVPADKIVLGAATYGHEFNGVEDGNTGLFQHFNKDDATVWRGGTIPFEALTEYYINKNGFVRYWDSAAQAPYLYSADEKIFISYDDEESVAAKVNYTKEKGLGGIMYWEYTSDLTGTLLNAMYEAMQ